MMAEFCAHSFLFGWCFEKRMRKINFSEKRCAQIFGRKRIGELPNLEAEPRQRVSARDLRERWPDEVWRRSFHRRFRGDFSRRLSNVDENAAFQRIDEKSSSISSCSFHYRSSCSGKCFPEENVGQFLKIKKHPIQHFS